MADRADQRIKEGYRALSGTDKAAIFLLSLEPESSSSLLEKMEDDEIRDLTIAMSNLGQIEAGVVEQLFVEFAESLTQTASLLGTQDTMERFLLNSMDPDKASEILDEIRGPAGRTIWEKLYNVNEQVLANYLKNEYPQTVAVVLSKIRSDHAARVLSVLPEGFANEVIQRLLRMETVQREILDGIERTMRTEFMSSLGQQQRRDSHEQMAEIINALDSATGDRFMAALAERSQESAEKINNLLFTFEDLSRLDPSGVQVLLRQVENDQLALALKGASEDMKNLIFTNMSERASKIMEEDMEALGGVRIKEVEEARTAVMDLAKSLSEEGELVLPGGGDEDELMY